MVEHRTENSGVEGSIPSTGTQSPALMKRSRRSYKYFSLLWALIKTQNIGFFFKKYALIPRVGINTTAETQTNEILSVDRSIDDYKNTTAKRISKQRAEFLDKKKKKTSYFHKKALKRLINITGTPATGVESVYYQKYLRRFSTKFLFQRGKLQLAGFLRGTFKYNYLSKKNSYVYETKFPQPKIEPAGPGDTWTLKINLLHLFLNSITKANLGYTTSWAFVSLNQQLVADEQKTAYRQLWSFRQLPGFRTNKKTFLFWYTKFFILRDPKELSLLISFWLVKTQIKTHKKIFFDIFGGVDTLFSIGKKQNRLLGYFLYFKGKLAKKGSVRKEKIFKKCGKIAAGTKSVRGNIVQYQAPTLTGTIGCAIGLFF